MNVIGKLIELYWNSVYAGYRKKYAISPKFDFRKSPNVILGGDGSIFLGNGSYIQSFSTIRAEKGLFVSIWDNVAIADHVRIYTCQQELEQFSYAHNPDFQFGNVIIESDCWLCSGVVITPGVHVGAGTVIGANSVVTHNLPADCLAGGVPARIIRFKTTQHEQAKGDPEWMNRYLSSGVLNPNWREDWLQSAKEANRR